MKKEYVVSSIGTKNFKCLKNIAPIEIKPITILVGENSCGKSSFLRLLPLMKQSAEENIDGPLSLFGSYVDFGDFQNVKSEGSKEDYFEFVLNGCVASSPRFRFRYAFSENKKIDYSLAIKFKTAGDARIYASSIMVSLGSSVSIRVDVNLKGRVEKVAVNNKDVVLKNEIMSTFLHSRHCLLPEFEEKESSDFYRSCRNFRLNVNLENAKIKEAFWDKLDRFGPVARLDVKECEKFASGLISEFNLADKKQSEFAREIIASAIPDYFDMVNRTLLEFLEGVRYSKPIRANAERYYRSMPLRLNEILADGSNLAQFLEGLGKSKRIELNRWLKPRFGFCVDVKGTVLKEVKIIVGRSEHNIIDMGYGFTQMLPIVVQLWRLIQKGYYPSWRMQNGFTFAIEQPELHLHPAMQKKMLRAFCDAAKLSFNDRRFPSCRFILETHSKTFVNLLGDLIHDKVIGAEDVNVLVFENKNGKRTKVIRSFFNEEGDLNNWPIGFFG